jgi:cellulose synthase operon protein C
MHHGAGAGEPMGPSEQNRALQNCEKGEALLAVGDLDGAGRAFRAVLAGVGPLEDGDPEGDGALAGGEEPAAGGCGGGGSDDGGTAEVVDGGTAAGSGGGDGAAAGSDAGGDPAAGSEPGRTAAARSDTGGSTAARSSPDSPGAAGSDPGAVAGAVADAEEGAAGARDAERGGLGAADAGHTATGGTAAPADDARVPGGTPVPSEPQVAGAAATLSEPPVAGETSDSAEAPGPAEVEAGPRPGADRLAARAHVGLGRLLLEAGEAGRAEREFRRAARLRPVDRDPLYWLGCAAAHQGAHETAELRLTEVVERWRGDGPGLVQRAYVRVRLGRHADALADLRSAERLGALDAEARWVLAALSGATARDVALLLGAAARTAMGRAPGRSPAADWSRAAALLDRARQLDPGERDFALPHAVALCLSGRREDGLTVLTAASRSAPTDRRLAHNLALMAWHALPPGDGETGTAEAGVALARGWKRCVAMWGGLLHDSVFWERRRAEAAGRYGTAVEDKDLVTLRGDLQDRLEALMPEGDTGGGPSAEALLHREIEAARLLAETGGLPLATDDGPLVCGPLRIVELGREPELGAFVGAAGEAAPALRQAFSHLGLAQALLGLDRPGEALAILSGLRCPSCRSRAATGRTRDPATAPAAAPAPHHPERSSVCDPDCAHFDARNPAYSGQAGRHRMLMRDGRALALAARLAKGRVALTPAAPDVRTAAASWRKALAHARAIEQGAEVEAIVADTALGAAKALHRSGDINAAAQTLQAAYALLGENQHDRLKGQLARVLTERGITRANADLARMEEPAADLRRAVELNPHLHRAQVNLGIVLRIHGARMRSSGSLVGARDRLQEAVDQLTDALARFPEDTELTEQRDLARNELALVHSELDQGRIGGLPE